MKPLLTLLCGVSLLASLLAHADVPNPVALSRDGVYSFEPLAASDSVRINDLLNKKTLTASSVCSKPQAGVLSRNEAYFLVICAGDKQVAWLNTASFQVVAKLALAFTPASIALAANDTQAVVLDAAGSNRAVLNIAQRKLQPTVDAPQVLASGKPNQVLVLGMLHSAHRKSKKYSLAVLEKTIRAIAPDVVLTEIPPNRFDVAAEQFKKDGKITEERVVLYPEYVDVLFPLQKALGFQIVPTSAWNEAMDTYRSAALKRIQADPARIKEWAALQGSVALSSMRIKQGGTIDDPLWIHTDAYDAASDIDAQAWAHFDKELGTGGWDTINRAHYANIARWLDQHQNEGKRILITYGAAHKGWILRQLRQRKDITLADMQAFLPKP